MTADQREGFIDLLPNVPGMGRTIVWHDERNWEYPTRGVLHAADAPIIPKAWDAAWPPFDQNGESSCTAQGAAGVLMSEPFRDPWVSQWLNEAAERYTLYRQAQYEDPWSGQAYEGSSTDAPFKVLRIRGYIREWRWCRGIDDVLRTLSYHGCVAIGVNWKQGMMQPDAEGYVRPTGSLVGGHVVYLHAVYPAFNTVAGINSWGAWGPLGGKFLMTYETLDALLRERGEACTIVRAR